MRLSVFDRKRRPVDRPKATTRRGCGLGALGAALAVVGVCAAGARQFSDPITTSATHAVELLSVICSAPVPSQMRLDEPRPPAHSSGTEPIHRSEGRSAQDTRNLPPGVSLAEIPGLAPPPARERSLLSDEPRVENLYAQATRAVKDGDDALAVRKLREALEISHRDHYEVVFELASVLSRMRRYGEARLAAELAAQLGHGRADVHQLLGDLCARQGRSERAAAHYRTATLAVEDEADNPSLTISWFALAELLEQTSRPAAAAEAYARFDASIWDTYPEHRNDKRIEAILARYPRGVIEPRVSILRRLGRMDEAISATEWAVRSRPEDPYLARLHVRALLDGKRFGRALETCRKRMEAQTVQAGFERLAVEAAIGTGILETWVADLARAVESTGAPAAAANTARHLDAIGRREQAIVLWRALSRADRSDADAAWALAGSLRGVGRLESAIKVLSVYLRENPDSLELPAGRLRTWMNRFASVDAFLALLPALERDQGRDFATDWVLGSLSAGAGRDALAERFFKASLQNRPDFALAHLAWAEMLAAGYQWRQVKEHARRALEISPNSAAAHFLLGQGHAGLDENDDAESAYKAALQFAADKVTYALPLARHYQRLASSLLQVPDRGDLQRYRLAAQRYFQEAFSLDPASGEALEGSVDSYLQAGKIEIAEAQLKAAEASGASQDVLRRLRTTIKAVVTPVTGEQYLAELQVQFAAHPYDVVTGVRYAEGLILRERFDDAFDVVRAVLKRSPDYAPALFIFRRVQLLRLEYEDVIHLLEQQVERYPNRAEILVWLASTYAYDFRPRDARWVYEHLIELATDERRANIWRGRVIESFRRFRDFDGALQYLDQLAGKVVDASWIDEKRALVLEAAGRHAAALALIEQRSANSPRDAKIRVCVYLVDSARDFGRAVSLIRELIADTPKDADLGEARLLRELLIDALLKDGKPAEALTEAEARPLGPRPNLAALVRLHARCLAENGRVDEAVLELEELLDAMQAARGRSNEPARVRLAVVQILLKAEQYDRAAKFCEQRLRQADKRNDRIERTQALNLQRITFQAAGRIDEYMAVMEQLLSVRTSGSQLRFGDLDIAGLNNDLGYTRLEAGQLDKRTARMIRRAVAEEPLNPAFLDSLGWLYYKSGDFSLASKHLSRSVAVLYGEDATVFDHLADAEYRLGDQVQAALHWKRALDLTEERGVETLSADDVALQAALREKISAHQAGRPVKTAPLASETR